MASINNVVEIAPQGQKTFPALEMKRRALLGELVIVTGAGDLPIDVLSGVLLSAAETNCSQTVGSWARRGAAFFRDGHHATDRS